MEPVGGCLGEIFTVPETMGFLPRFYHEDHENSCIFLKNVPEKKKKQSKRWYHRYSHELPRDF